MHVLLTDRLCCPRCGPPFGLILIADRIEERRVLEAFLGCPNCREQYPVREGFADLRPPPRPPLDEWRAAPVGEGGAPRGDSGAPATRAESGPTGASAEGGGAGDGDEALRLGALLGVAAGSGHLLLLGAPAVLAPALAARLDGVEVVGSHPSMRALPERAGVSRLATGAPLPFFDRTVRGVALGPRPDPAELDEAVRVVASRGRVVVAGADPGVREHLEGRGLRALLDEAGVVVAARE